MRQSTLDTTTPADDVVVEAPTAEQALAEVNARLGSDASIVEAGKVLRGGVGGFFAREVVQLRARARTADGEPDSPVAPSAPAEPAATAAPVAEPPHTTTTGDETGLERLLAGITADVDDAERSFGDVLRRQLGHDSPILFDAQALPRAAVRGPDDPVALAAPVAPAPAAAPAPAPAPRTVEAPADDPRPGTPTWSAENLKRLGLPSVLVEAVTAGAPGGDAAWVRALADALAPLCRRLPEGPMLLAGERALPLADGLGLPIVAPGCKAPVGSFAVRSCVGADKRDWIAGNCVTRWLHAVVGGSGWRQLLFAGPSAVSWVEDSSLPEVLQVAVDLGVPLGFGTERDATGAPTPANPVDVAVAIRALLPRR